MKIRKDVNVIITFDDKEYSEEEQCFLIGRFIMCLMRMSAKQDSEKFKTKKEQQIYTKNFIDFSSKALQDIRKQLK